MVEQTARSQVGDNLKPARLNVAEGESLTRKAWRRFRRHRLAMIGLSVLTILCILTVFAPIFSVGDPTGFDLRARNLAPGEGYLLGTDGNGRDIWTRVLFGGRVSLSVGLVAVSISTLIGVTIGCISGYYGGWIDNILMRITDMFMTLPLLIVVITLVAITGPSIYNSMFAIGVLSWTAIARLVRGQFLSLREEEFTLAARATGASNRRIIFRHLLPNTIGLIMVEMTFAVSNAILLEAALSFLGLGVQIPTPSWGNMLRDAQTISVVENYPWMWLPPGLMILLAVLSVNFIGDGLRDALDPKAVI
jgi:peptide/nickel transport system permease protein